MYNYHCFDHFRDNTANGTTFSFIIEGTTEKVLQLMMPLKPIYNQNLDFFEQKTLQRGSNNKNTLIDIIFAMKIFF
jgi:hypothetical protein